MWLATNKWRGVIAAWVGLVLLAVTMVVMVPEKPVQVRSVELPETVVDRQIRVTFSAVVDKKAVQDAFVIKPEVEGYVSWAGKTFVFTGAGDFEEGVEYWVGFKDLMDGEGIRFLIGG